MKLSRYFITTIYADMYNQNYDFMAGWRGGASEQYAG